MEEAAGDVVDGFAEAQADSAEMFGRPLIASAGPLLGWGDRRGSGCQSRCV